MAPPAYRNLRDADVGGKRFTYHAAGRIARGMTFRPDHRLEGAPSIHEHSWEIADGKLIFRHRDGRPTVELEPVGRDRYQGRDWTTSPPSSAQLSPTFRSAFPRLNLVMRQLRYAFHPDRRPQAQILSPAQLLDNSLTLRLGAKLLRWIFPSGREQQFLRRALLPWVWPQHQLLDARSPVDFTIGVHLNDATIRSVFAYLPGRKFLLGGEKETRHPRLPDCVSFVQNSLPDDDPAYIRYAPTFCCWCPPRNEPKTRKCSVVDNGQYAWRSKMIHELAKHIGDVDIFGKLSGRPLGGYHWKRAKSEFGNDKYLGLENSCFYLAIERAVAQDYITEKFTDAILCQTVPIYDGAPNIALYARDNSYINAADIQRVDWYNWRQEYEKRRPALLAQKELIRTRLNVFSYFHLLTEDLSLLAKPRPITA